MKDLFGGETYRALTWREPFASLMLKGKIETRVWPTRYRGMVLICAGQKPYTESELMDICGVSSGAQRILNFLNSNAIKERPGYAIAIGRLVNCRLMQPRDEDKCFVHYRPELMCHIYEDVIPIEPFPYKGQQGWKQLGYDIIKKIKPVT